MKAVNQYSFLVSAGMIFLLGAVFFLRHGVSLRGILGVLGMAILLGGVWFVIRPRQSSTDDLARVEEYIGGEKPVLLEFQSPF